ncbi:MAG: hypothetical protein VW125_03525 [Flavobacteriaceae bacterium]
MKKRGLKRIGILGCGWLGTQLALTLKAQKWEIKVSKTTTDGTQAFKQQGWNSFRILLTEEGPQGDLSFFNALDQLVISIPPSRKGSSSYSAQIKTLIYSLQSHTKCRILLLSSTSVYGTESGKFDENSIPNPQTPASKELLLAENTILQSKNSGVIVRLGGLVGEDRNPIFQLQHKLIPNPRGRINFIHQLDAVNGILTLLSKTERKGVYNLVSPHHPIREDYYTFMAKKHKLPTPVFANQDPVVERWIEASKIAKETRFQYQVDNLLI